MAPDSGPDYEADAYGPFANMARRINNISTSKGFTPPNPTNMPEKLMLAVSELAEALEEHRSEKPTRYYKCVDCGIEEVRKPADHVGHYVPSKGILGMLLKIIGRSVPCMGREWKPEGLSVELADTIIRCLHMMDTTDDDVDDVIEEKVAYNAGRPYKHGRNY